jgi:hypothetical protein
LPIQLLLLSLLISHIHHPWHNWHFNLQVKSWISSTYFVWFGIHLSPHLKAPHNSSPYIRHYFPEVNVSSRRIN